MSERERLKQIAVALIGEFTKPGGFIYKSAVKTINNAVDELTEERAIQLITWVHENTKPVDGTK